MTKKSFEDDNKSKKRTVPKGWKLSSLADKSIIEIIMGQSPQGETYNKDGIGLPFFQHKWGLSFTFFIIVKCIF